MDDFRPGVDVPDIETANATLQQQAMEQESQQSELLAEIEAAEAQHQAEQERQFLSLVTRIAKGELQDAEEIRITLKQLGRSAAELQDAVTECRQYLQELAALQQQKPPEDQTTEVQQQIRETDQMIEQLHREIGERHMLLVRAEATKGQLIAKLDGIRYERIDRDSAIRRLSANRFAAEHQRELHQQIQKLEHQHYAVEAEHAFHLQTLRELRTRIEVLEREAKHLAAIDFTLANNLSANEISERTQANRQRVDALNRELEQYRRDVEVHEHKATDAGARATALKDQLQAAKQDLNCSFAN